MKSAIVLLSSGLDSTVAFKKTYDECKKILCLTFDYGQKARYKEIEYSSMVCKIFKVNHEIIKLPWYYNFKGALTNSTEIPTPKESELGLQTAKQVWVPARNLVFLSIASAFAENYNYEYIVTGFDLEEAETFPDNSLQFIESMNNTLKLGTFSNPKIYAPLVSLNKSEIIKLGIKINATLEWSWSCYTSREIPCGKCESCLRRKKAFKSAGVQDPLLSKLGVNT